MHIDYVYQTSHACCAKTKAFNILTLKIKWLVQESNINFIKTFPPITTQVAYKNTSHTTHPKAHYNLINDKNTMPKSPRMYKSLLQLDQQQK